MTDAPAQDHKAVMLTTATFDSTINNQEKLPVLVDFYADWCGPCKMAAPIIEKLAGEYQGKVIVAKVDTDANIEVARKYGVMSIPTVMVFKDGQVVEKQIGFPGEPKYRQMLDKAAA